MPEKLAVQQVEQSKFIGYLSIHKNATKTRTAFCHVKTTSEFGVAHELFLDEAFEQVCGDWDGFVDVAGESGEYGLEGEFVFYEERHQPTVYQTCQAFTSVGVSLDANK